MIFTAMCTRSGIGNPLRIGGGVVRNGGGWEGWEGGGNTMEILVVANPIALDNRFIFSNSTHIV